MNFETARITKLRDYLFSIIDTLVTTKDYQINANMLSNDIDNYSLDKIPTASTIERWVNGTIRCRDVFSFRSRNTYSQDVINNLANIGFFEEFESLVNSNNKKGILPKIDNIESIECLNSGTMLKSEANTAEFNIQIQIVYRLEKNA